MEASTPGTQRPTTTAKRTTKRKPATAGARTTRTAASPRRTTRSTTSSTQPKTRVEHAQVIAERAVLVPVGASLLARDNLVSTVKGLTKYRTRTHLERELKRYERRGATARNRLERQVRRTRTRVERELRQRRSLVERTMRQNRRRLNREITSVRKDLGKQSGAVSARVERIVSDAQGLLGS